MIITPYTMPVAYWSYEKAYPDNVFMEFERTSCWAAIEEHWARHFGTGANNKVVYKLVVKGTDGFQGQYIYVSFKDFKVIMGSGVRPYTGSILSKPRFPIEQNEPQY